MSEQVRGQGGGQPPQAGLGGMSAQGGVRRGPNVGRRESDPEPNPAINQNDFLRAVGMALQTMHQTSEARTATKNMDKTVPGGCFIVDGVVVDAHNNVIDQEKASEDLQNWMDAEADRQQNDLVLTEAEEPGEVELTPEQKKVAESNAARLRAAEEIRKRAEAKKNEGKDAAVKDKETTKE